MLYNASFQGPRTFHLHLSNASGGIEILQASAAGTIEEVPQGNTDSGLVYFQNGSVVGRKVTGLSAAGGATFWEGDTVTFTAALDNQTAQPSETFVWEQRGLMGIANGVTMYDAWGPLFQAAGAPTVNSTFNDPFVGQVRVTVTSGGTTTSKVIDVRAKAAFPTNFHITPPPASPPGTPAQGIRLPGTDYMTVYYAWDSSSARPGDPGLGDLDAMEMGEYVWYTRWGFPFGYYTGPWPYTYNNPPFDYQQPDGRYILVPSTDGAAMDEHGQFVKIVNPIVGRKPDVAHQYYYYKQTGGYNYAIVTSNANGYTNRSVGGDQVGEVKLKSADISHSVIGVGLARVYKIDKGGDGSVQIDLTGLNFPWIAQ